MIITIEIKEHANKFLSIHPSCTKPETPLERKMSDKLFAAFVATLQMERASEGVRSSDISATGTTKDLGCVALEWDAYAKTYDSMVPAQREQLMESYYAGALGMYKLTIALSDLPHAEGASRLEALRLEVVEFLRQTCVRHEARARTNN